MGDSQNDIIQLALQIATVKGYASLEEYAANLIEWKKPHPGISKAKYVATHEGLKPEPQLILEALKLDGKLQSQGGYYSNDFLAGESLAKTIDKVAVERIVAQHRKTKMRAHKALRESDHKLLLEYAAAEIPWQPRSSESSRDFFVRRSDITDAQQDVLETLKSSGASVSSPEGQDRNSYVATGMLAKVIGTMQANVHETKLSVSSPRSPDKVGR